MKKVENCRFCATKYERRRKNQTTCGAYECRKKAKVERERIKRGVKRVGEIAGCQYCETEYKKKFHNQSHCGSAACAEKQRKKIQHNKNIRASDTDMNSDLTKLRGAFLSTPPVLPRDMYAKAAS